LEAGSTVEPHIRVGGLYTLWTAKTFAAAKRRFPLLTDHELWLIGDHGAWSELRGKYAKAYPCGKLEFTLRGAQLLRCTSETHGHPLKLAELTTVDAYAAWCEALSRHLQPRRLARLAQLLGSGQVPEGERDLVARVIQEGSFAELEPQRRPPSVCLPTAQIIPFKPAARS
jgi:hypothetical protein